MSPQRKWLIASIQRWKVALFIILWLTITILVASIVNHLTGSTPTPKQLAGPKLFITLAWDLPVDQNTGLPYDWIDRTVLYMGTSSCGYSGCYQARIELAGGPAQTTQTVLINHPQTFFAVTVKDIWGAESSYSNEVEWDQ